jgi:hypothetical protein
VDHRSRVGAQHVHHISQCCIDAECTTEERLRSGSWIRDFVVAGIHKRDLTAQLGHCRDGLACLHTQSRPGGQRIPSRRRAICRPPASGRLQHGLAGLWDNERRGSRRRQPGELPEQVGPPGGTRTNGDHLVKMFPTRTQDQAGVVDVGPRESAADEAVAAGTELSERPGCLRMQSIPLLGLRARAAHPEWQSAGTEAATQPDLGEPFRQHGTAHVAGADEEDTEASLELSRAHSAQDRAVDADPEADWDSTSLAARIACAGSFLDW